MTNIKHLINVETRTVKVNGDYIREAKAEYEDGIVFCTLQHEPSLRYSAYKASYVDYLTGVTSEEPELIEEFPVYPDLEPLTEAYHVLFSMPRSDEQKWEEINEEMSEYKTPDTDEYEVKEIIFHNEEMFAPGFGMEQIEVEFKSKLTGKSMYCALESMYDNMYISESPILNEEGTTPVLEEYEGLEEAEESEYYEVFYKTYKEYLAS